MFVGILFLQIYKESPILGIKSYQNDGCLDSGTFEQSFGVFKDLGVLGLSKLGF